MPPSERPLTRYLSYRARNDGIPLSGTFELSPVCDLACRMCYVRRSPAEVAAHPRPIMTLEQWKRLGDEIFDAGTLFLLLTGGEPFLWPDFRELYEYLHRKGFLVSVNSNGTLISDDTVGWLRDSPPSRINITLYGAGEEAYERLCGVRGVYSRVTANIDRLLAAGIPVKLNASMTPENVSDMEGIVEFARQRDLSLELGTYMFPPARRDRAHLREYSRFTSEDAARYTLQYHRLTKPPDQYRRFLEQAASGFTPPPAWMRAASTPWTGRCAARREERPSGSPGTDT